MFSGNDANIDWAILAQQWIQRNTQTACSETFNPDNSMPQVNTQTHIQVYDKRTKMHPGAARNSSRFEEKGEADMDMDDDSSPVVPMTTTNIDGTNVMLPQEPQWLPPPLDNMDVISQRQDAPTTWNAWPNPQNVPVVPQQFAKSNPTAHIPSLLRINVSNPNERSDEEANGSNSANAIEAAKRKVLPAWIREGLEKMEREKQKQLEREQLKKDSGCEQISSPTNKTVNEHISRDLESDESSGNEHEEDVPFNHKNIKLKSNEKSARTHQIPTDMTVKDDEDGMPILDMGKSYEQKLADLMVSVRRNLTELLLEVTNEEIAKISRETINASKLKASSAQVVRKSALSSITSKLGLAAYSSSGESDDDSDDSADSDDDVGKDGRRRVGTNSAADDSEEEIKTQLRIRRRAFAKISEEIEERIAVNAVREEQKLKYYKQKEQKQDNDNDKKHDKDASTSKIKSNSSSSSTSGSSGMGKNYSRDFGETTTESKLQQSNGKRSKERGIRRGGGGGERTTRFSDNKDSKHINAVTASYISQLTASSVVSPPTGSLNPTPVALQQFPMTTVVNNLPDVTKVRDIYSSSNANMNSMLNAADAALEKAAAKSKSAKTSSRSNVHDNRDRDRDRRQRRRTESQHRSSDNSNSSTTSSSESDSSSSSSSDSRDSKYSRTSSNSNSRHNNKHASNRYRYDERQYRQKRERSERDERHYRSQQHQRQSSKTSTSSSKSKHGTGHSTSSRHRSRSRSRDRSRSRSTYSSSSSKRHRR